MCVLTYVPTEGGAIITSNRDEQFHRPTEPPAVRLVGGRELVFPMDKRAGGTWIAMDKGMRARNLLNGAKDGDEHRAPYPGQKSRGTVLLESFGDLHPEEFADRVDLENVEPFTLIMFELQDNNLFELKWDRKNRTFREVEANQPSIWSSVTLYSPELRSEREQRFNELIRSQGIPGKSDLIDFHTAEMMDDREKEKEHGLKTVSTTQVNILRDLRTMEYLDRVNDQKIDLEI